jgi:hypothetical protein
VLPIFYDGVLAQTHGEIPHQLTTIDSLYPDLPFFVQSLVHSPAVAWRVLSWGANKSPFILLIFCAGH